MKNILIITASNGHNLELSKKIQSKIKNLKGEAEILDLVDLDLPLYSPKAEGKGVPEALKNNLPNLGKADALFFVAPEYNGGTPPTFGNFLAWTSRSSDDWRKNFNGVTTAIATFSASGGVNVLNTMRLQLSYLGANVLGRHIHTNFSKELKDEELEAVCRLLLS